LGKARLRLIFLAARPSRFLSTTSPACSIFKEGQDLLRPPVVGFVHGLRVERGQIGLGGGVELVEHVVQAFGLADPAAVVPLQDTEQAVEHGLQHVGEPRRLARRAPERDNWRLVRGEVQVHRPRRVGHIDADGQPAPEQGGVELGRRRA
jgi:hypothetical protein